MRYLCYDVISRTILQVPRGTILRHMVTTEFHSQGMSHYTDTQVSLQMSWLYIILDGNLVMRLDQHETPQSITSPTSLAPISWHLQLNK